MTFRLSAALVFAACIQAAPDQDGVRFFETRIRPVLVARCAGCHGGTLPAPQGALVLDTVSGLRKGGNSGALFAPGDPESSLIIRAVRHSKDLKMPPGKPLPPEIVEDLENWVRMGAPLPQEIAKPVATQKSRQHWAFLRPRLPEIPRIADAATDIDRFIVAKLAANKLTMSAPADRATLIRRVTYDLTGLPPSADEIDAFVADRDPRSYERLVDRLLASPSYGERWGRYWLDVARYSDTRGTGDRFAFSYTYRDWVIRAFNDDMPYDQFLRQQLASDRIPNNARRHLAALGYISLGRAFPKSYPETVDDRIDVVMRGMQGLTVACARCHDHKFDPIPTQDYYSLYAVLANIREPQDLPLLGVPGPRTIRDQVYESRLKRIRETDSEYRARRSAEMNAFFRQHISDYLIATRDSRKMSNTEREELVRDRQLNLHVLARWRGYLSRNDDPVFRLWNAAAALPESEWSTRWADLTRDTQAHHPLVLAEFASKPPASAADLAYRYQNLLLKYDRPRVFTDAAEEMLRQAMWGKAAPSNVPLEEFELVYTEGDGNNTRGFERRYESMRAMHAYEGAAPRAMAIEDVPKPQKTFVFVRGNPNNPGAETPPQFLSCLSDGERQRFVNGSGRLELANAIASRENPLTARVMVNRVWMYHFGAGIVRTPSDFGLRGEAPTHPELLDYLAVRFMESGWSIKKLHRMILLSAAYQQASADRPEARKVDPENLLLWRMNRRRLDVESLRDSMLAASGQLDPTRGGVPFSLAAIPSVPRRTVYGFIERGRVPAFLTAFDFAVPDQHSPMRYTTTVPQQALFLMNSPFVAEQARYLSASIPAGSDHERIRTLYRRVLGRNPSEEELQSAAKFVATQGADEGTDPQTVWHYGFGEYDSTSGHVASFRPFRYFTGDSWQGASMLPDRVMGSARLRANGGEPGDGARQAVIRRWVSPLSGKVVIEGSVRHRQDALGTGDGIRARIVSSRAGELASWVLNGSGAETKLDGIAVQTGDTIDFIVDSRTDNENDGFTWPLEIRSGKDKKWNAAADFKGPAPKPLNAWEQFAQVLLNTNEFAFVD